MSSPMADTPIKTEKMKHDAISHGLTADDIRLNCLHHLHHLGERQAPRLLEGEEPQGMLKLYGMMNEMNHTTSAMEKIVIQLKTMTQQVIFSVAEQQLCMDLNEAEQWVWAMEKIAVQIRTMTHTICQTGTGDQHSQHGELVPHSEHCIADSLAHQYNYSIASDAAVDLIDSGQTYLHQTTGTGNKKIDFKYDLLVCQTSPSPASHKIIKKTVATDLAHHISEVIKLSLAFKTQLISLRPDAPKYRNSIGSSLKHNYYVQCRHCSNFERDRPNLGSESPTSTVPMKLYHGSATCDTVNTPGSSKRSQCRHLGLKNNSEVDYKLQHTKSVNPTVSLIERSRKWRRDAQLPFPQADIRTCQCAFKASPPYLEHILQTNVCQCDDQPLSRPPKQPPDECLERISSAAQLGKWQSTDYSTRLMGDSRPTQPPEDCHQRTQGLRRILGDCRPPGQPPDLHEEGMVTLPIGIAPISRDSPEGHVKTTQVEDRRPPGKPRDLHEEGMLTLPSGIASISRDSPETEGHVKTIRTGDGRPPGKPRDLHEEGMLTLPSGIASISRDSPETEGHVKTIRTGDGRPPGQPPDLHEEGMLTLPSGIAPISRDSPEGQVKKTRAGDGRPPGQPPDIHEEGMLTLPSGIAPISRASPEGDNTPDNCHRWTSQPLGFIKLMGDGRTPGDPPDHYYKVTSQFLDYTRVMGDGRTPGEPPDHCHKGTSQPLDHNTIWGLYLPFYRASSAFLWTVPVLMSRRHRLVDFYCVYSAFLWTVLVLMARRHRLVDFYCVSSAFLWIVPVVLARRHRLVDFYHALPRRPSTKYQADASLTLLKGTTGNDSTQRISEYWNENYQHVIVRPTGHLSNGWIVPVTIGGIDIQVHVLIVIPIVRDGHPRGQSPEECRLNNCSSGYQTDILHSSSESIQAINECSNSPSTLEQVTGDLNNGCFIPVITESDVAAVTDNGSQKHHMLFGSDATAKVVTDVPLFIIEDQTYPVDVIIPAPDELLLKGGFLSRHNCIPWWGIGVESETELLSFMPDCSYPSDVIKSPYNNSPECQNNSAGPHDMLLKGGFMSRHNCIPDCSSSGVKLRLFYTMICSFLYDSSDPPDLAHSSRPSVIFREEWFLPRFNCIPEYDHISLCVDNQDIWCIPIVHHADLDRSHVSSKFMVTALDNQLHNVTCPHMPRMLFVYLDMTAVRYGPSKPHVMLDINVLVTYLKQFQMIATTKPGMINPTLALDSCYRTDRRLTCACHRYIDVRPTPRHMDRGILTECRLLSQIRNTFRECCTAPEWCDTFLKTMTSDLHKLLLIIQMVTVVFCKMLDMDNAQPVETTPLLQNVSYSLMDDIYQIKCIKPPQEHLIDISQEDQWMTHTPTGFTLGKDEQLDNTQYPYIVTLCLSISYRRVKNDGKHCDQEMSNNHHRISDHLKIDFALSNIPDVSHQNMTYSCWWSKVDQNRITKLVTRCYVSNHIKMDYAPGNKPETFQEYVNLLSGVLHQFQPLFMM